ncbi:VOC family protein [Streptomyces sp. NPDC056304]|uniref:VOC family protein n=1 Tax=unclassified Streptomyces TaxID=2593676 RepID=UPI0035E2BC22
MWTTETFARPDLHRAVVLAIEHDEVQDLAPEPRQHLTFRHRLLGGSFTRTATHHSLQIDGFLLIVIQHAPGQMQPQWPDGVPQQMHFDLATDDVGRADKRVLDAGGRLLRPTDDVVASAQQGSGVYAVPGSRCARP